MKVFKIKMEDKAAFLNKMEKAGTPLDTNNIKDNELEGYFTVSSSDLEQQQNIKTILDQSLGINTMNESNVEKVKVNRLKKGDILSGSNVEVVWVGQTIQTPKGKTRVDIKYPSGNVVSKYWTTNTIIGIVKKDENLKTENKMENKKSISKDKLKEMIRQEFQGVLAEKKKVKDEDKKEKLDENEDMQIDESLSGAESLIAGILGLGVPLAALITAFVRAAIKKGGKAAAQELSDAISKSTQADQ